jgi:hypothetical protein
VPYGNGTFVAVGWTMYSPGTTLTSADGITWTSRTSGSNFPLYGVTYGNGTFIAVGLGVPISGGTILTSADGITWTLRTSGTSNSLYGVTYGNGTFIAVGYYGTILTSTDGITWTARTSGSNFTLYGVTYGNGTFIAVGDGGTILQSDPVDIAPHITANNSSGQITLNQSDALSVFVSLDAGDGLDIDADWWLAAYTPFGWYYYVYPDQWYYASVLEDIRPAYQGPLFDLSQFETLNITQLPSGAYTFYFGVDLDRNGIIDFDQLYLNSVSINVVP